MTINYTTEPIKPERTYPWVGMYETNKRTIVLFTKPGTGFCLDSKDESNIFLESGNWTENKFIPCSITLSSL